MDVSVTNVALGLDGPDAFKKINSTTAARGVGRVRSVASVDPFSVSGYFFREFAFSGSRNRSTFLVGGRHKQQYDQEFRRITCWARPCDPRRHRCGTGASAGGRRAIGR
jgi:hypothetical protein